MNVIVANKYQELLVNLDIDIIKTMTGEFDVEELINTFSNFFFNKMVLDVTAIKDYKDISNIQRLSMNLDMSKVVLLLDDSAESTTPDYLSRLISMGIYNFTKNVENVKYLVDNPNSYKDVAHYHKLDGEINPNMSAALGDFAPDIASGPKVLGVKNITSHAGATTLIYMMKKQLQQNYSVMAIEVNRNDFVYFNDKELVSTTHTELPKVIMKATSHDIILIDLNDSDDEDACNDVIYLIEPSTIKLNKMIRRNKMIFDKLKGRKIVLNKSLLDAKDVSDFTYESRSEVFYNIPPLDDKINRHRVLDDFMAKVGFVRQSTPMEMNDQQENQGGILNMFKK